MVAVGAAIEDVALLDGDGRDSLNIERVRCVHDAMRCLPLVIVMLACPIAAQAQDALDKLILDDGAVLQGHVVELQPEERVTFMLLSGEVRIIEWTRIAHASGPAFLPASAEPRQVPLIVESVGRPQKVALDQRLILVRGRPSLVDEPQCTTPCTLYVEPGARILHLAGDGVVPTKTDVVVPPEGLHLKMRAPSPTRSFAAGALDVVGITALILGTSFAAVGGAENAAATRDLHDGMLGAGVGMLCGGTATLAIGIAIAASNKKGIAWQGPVTF
jgi:hypothetical protein